MWALGGELTFVFAFGGRADLLFQLSYAVRMSAAETEGHQILKSRKDHNK